MSKHDLKGIKLQINTILSKLVSFISVQVPLRYSDSFDLSNPLSLITKQMLDDATGGGFKVLAPWDGEPTGLNEYRTHPVGDIEYLFRSLAPDNITEPTLNPTTGAWIQTDIFGFIGVWNSGGSYDAGTLVTGDANTNVYRSKVDDNIGNNPDGGANPDEWELVGAYVGFYFPGTFNLGDVVIVSAESNRIYISAIPDNEQPITDVIVDSTWKVIGPIAETGNSLTFDQSDLTEVYEGNYSLSFNLPVGKSVGSIETKAGTVTRRINTSQAVTDTANDPNTIIEGFDNNSPQTITIKLI